MLPNLLVGDYLFVNKYAYGYSKYSFPFAPNLFEGRLLSSEPKRGDVVVFRVVDDGDKDYIKRIVGLPGDKIRFENGSVIVNDKPTLIGKIGDFGTDTIDAETIGADIITENLDNKTYQTLDTFQSPYDNTGEYIVPQGHYFFAGDNRDNSQDSRFIDGPVGFVPQDRIIGRAEFIFFSIKNSSFLEFWNWASSIRFDRIFKKIN
jgi:signal peptidase I